MSAAVCALLLGTSCQNEDIVNQAATQEFTLKLDMGANSRTMMSENGPVWGNEEELYVVGDNGNSYGTLRMVWRSSDGKSAMFSGKITGDASRLEHMVYPKPVDNQIQMNTLNGANYNAPMVGSIEDGEVVDLGYIGSLVSIELDGLKGAEIQNDPTGAKVIGGYYQFNPVNGTIEFKADQNGTLTITNIPDDGIVYIPVHTTADQNSKETIYMQLTGVTPEGSDTQTDLGTPIVINANVAKNALVESNDNGFAFVGDEVVEYDVISDYEGFNTACTNGGVYKLGVDLNVGEDVTFVLKNGKEMILDLNGKKLSATSIKTGSNYNMFDVNGGTLTVMNGEMEYEHKGDNMMWNSSTNLFNVTAGGVLTLNGVTAKNLGGSDMGFVVHLNNWGEVTLNVESSTLESNYVAVRVFNSGYDMNNVTIKNSTLKGGNYAFWVHNYTLADFGTQEKVDAQKKLLNFDVSGNGNTFVGKNDTPVRYGMTDAVYSDDVN